MSTRPNPLLTWGETDKSGVMDLVLPAQAIARNPKKLLDQTRDLSLNAQTVVLQ
jgi:hypothetical protein